MSARRPRRARQRGMSALEAMVAAGVGIVVLLGASQLMVASQDLSRATDARARAAETLRRNLEAVGNLLQSVSQDSLGNFDLDDHASAPLFRLVEGQVGGVPLRGGVEQLSWRPSPRAVAGVSQPGRIVRVDASGAERLVADQVAADGFRVTRQGRVLIVRMKVYESDGMGGVLELEGSTAVSVRN